MDHSETLHMPQADALHDVAQLLSEPTLPYYAAASDECALFEHASRQRLPVHPALLPPRPSL